MIRAYGFGTLYAIYEAKSFGTVTHAMQNDYAHHTPSIEQVTTYLHIGILTIIFFQPNELRFCIT